jgi:ribosome-binding factor A
VTSGSRGAPAGAPTQRQLRVGEEIRHILAGLFTRDLIHDPKLSGVVITVTEVRVSPDLRNATAFVTRLGRDDVDKLLPSLKKAAPFLRGQIAKAIRLRVAPMLSFQADTSIDYAMEVNKLLHRPDVARDLANEQAARTSD